MGRHHVHVGVKAQHGGDSTSIDLLKSRSGFVRAPSDMNVHRQRWRVVHCNIIITYTLLRLCVSVILMKYCIAIAAKLSYIRHVMPDI
jgi:hypothetical protein